MGYSGAGGKLNHEKNQKQKISWHCPFKLQYIICVFSTILTCRPEKKETERVVSRHFFEIVNQFLQDAAFARELRHLRDPLLRLRVLAADVA
jgi:hypothetical protein